MSVDQLWVNDQGILRKDEIPKEFDQSEICNEGMTMLNMILIINNSYIDIRNDY